MTIWPTPLRSSIDIGSNSLLLLVGAFDEQGRFNESANECEVTGLGKKIDENRAFLPESMEDTFQVLAQYKKKIQKFGINPESTIITATEAARVAENSPAFFNRVRKELGLSIKTISAAGESYYSALGVYLGLFSTGPFKNKNKKNQKHSDEHIFIMDVGGASTEIIKAQLSPFATVDFVSLPMGSVRALEWKEKNLQEEKISEILTDQKERLKNFRTSTLICIAGTMTSFANIFIGNTDSYVDGTVHGVSFTEGEFTLLLQSLSRMNLEELSRHYSFLGKRSSTLRSGGEVALSIGRALGVHSYHVSIYGARYGTLYEGKVKDEFIHQSQ